MSRQAVRLLILVVVVAGSWFLRQPKNSPFATSAPTANSGVAARQTWGHPDTLPDHFARHGADFHARDADDYAAKAAAFLQRAKIDDLPAKRAADGSLRIYDAATDTFGAYNADGTTRTFFKPGSPTYFERQPGEPVYLRPVK
jgi:pyocin large subunit-like protein